MAGFIGYSISDFLLKKKFNTIGLDSLNNYYNLKLKKKRLSNLKKNNNFHFLKLNLNDRKNLFKKLKKYKIDLVIHLAAQPGVRYSLKFPKTYVDNNISASAIVPSGASTGTHEAFELRDVEDKEFLGKSVFKAVEKVNKEISKNLKGCSITEQKKNR